MCIVFSVNRIKMLVLLKLHVHYYSDSLLLATTPQQWTQFLMEIKPGSFQGSKDYFNLI